MALNPTVCAPCAFGAVSTSILSLPYNVVGSIDVHIISHVTTLNGTATTSFETTTISQVPATLSATPTDSDTSISTITFGSTPQWTVSGVVLTYPTTYVQYLGFEGVAAPTDTACAQTLIPSALTLPSSTDPASFIYPAVTGAVTLPDGLLSYLDADGGIPDQLGGDQLTKCAAIDVAVVSIPSSTVTFTVPPNATLSELPGSSTTETTTATITSTSFSASTQTLTSETTVASTISSVTPPSETSIVESTTLTSTAPIAITTEQTVVSTQTISHPAAVIVNTITGAPIVRPSATPQSEVLASSSASASSAASVQASQLLSNLFNVLGSLEASAASATAASSTSATQGSESAAATSSAFSLAPGPYFNGTSASSLPTFLPSVYPSGVIPGNASGTTTPVQYTGGASNGKADPSTMGSVFGVLAAMLFL